MPPTTPFDPYPSGMPAASIYFDGLLCLCFNGATECTVGVNNQTSSHALKFRIWRKAKCEEVADITIPQDPQHRETIQIEVNKPVVPGSTRPPGVYVYHPSGAPASGRDSYSFWLDMEEPRAHGAVLTKLSNKLYPRFQIKHALFSTYAVSQSKFRFEIGGTVFSTLERIALAIVADIFHEPTGSIDIKRNGSLIMNLPALSGDEYEIAITNSCMPGKCSYSTTGTTPKDRNDFYLYYDVVDVASSKQLELVNYAAAGSGTSTPLGKCSPKDQRDPMYPLSDRTPCMPIVFGLSSTL